MSDLPAPDHAPGATDERAWVEAELSLVVRSRRELEEELDRARQELASARLEHAALLRRRSVGAALAAADALRPLRSLARRLRPRTPAPTRPAARTPSDASPRATPAEFRSRLRERLARPGDLRVVVVDRADPTHPDPSVEDLRDADVIVATTAGLDIRTVRGRGVSVAIVGPDVSAWLDQPWLDDFDVIATSNPATAEAISAQRSKVPVVAADPLTAVQDLVAAWLAAHRIGIDIGIPNWDEAPAWGDLHFARALQRQFERAGHPARVHIRPDWTDAVSARDDVSLHLFGLSPRPRVAGQRTYLWIISHPLGVTDALTAAADRIYVASDAFAGELAGRTSVPVAPLHQATDPARFHPDPTGPHHEVLFVGNSRGVRREILADLAPTTFDLAVYGRWAAGRIDPAHLRGEHVPNEDLHRYYASADVVLNDHWADMRDAGFLSNRLYDAFASGACVVSDRVPGIEEEFDNAVVTYAGPGELRLRIHDLLADEGRRRALADRGRAAVLARHTFEHRASQILADVRRDLGAPSPR